MNVATALDAISEADLAPLDVRADLTVAIEGENEDLRVRSQTDTLLVDVPSVGVALGLARRSSGLLPGVADVLAAADLTVGVAIDGTGVAVLGADARPGPLARRIGPHVEIRDKGVAKALLGAIVDCQSSDGNT